MRFVRTKRNRIILWILLIVLSIGGGTAGFTLCRNSVSAAAESISLSEENAKLVLPSSYEQYLSLSSPSSVAISDKYIAIADGKIIYIYDRTNLAQGYRTYTYNGGNGVTVGKMQFSPSGRLYFLSTAGLYELSLDDEFQKKQVVSFTPYTFLVEGDTLFTVTTHEGVSPAIYSFEHFENVQQPLDLSTASHSNISIAGTETANHPLITLADDILYCAIGDNVSRYDPATLQGKNSKFYLNSSANPIPISICATKGALYYTTMDGLYRSDLNGKAEAIVKGASFGALTEWDENLYFLQDKAVQEYNIAEQKITDYEITAASASTNRLNGATESVRAGDLLVTADKGNNRISVYDFAEKSFETLSCEGVTHVATDGELIAAATDTDIFIYEPVYEPENHAFVLKQTAEFQQNNVVGVVCVYDAIYFITGDYYYGKIVHADETPNGWAASSKQRSVGSITPKAITADLFGDIFVADNTGKVYELHEDDFATAGELGDSVAEIGSDFSSLRAGFDGTLYYLDESGKFCGEDGEIANIDGARFVYTGETEKKPVSFALGYEDDEVYFCFGDFIVKSEAGALGLETLEKVSRDALNNSAETLSAVPEPDKVALADFEAGSVGIQVNLSALQDGGNFAAGYYRYDEKRRGVVLAEHGAYSLVALYEEHVYTVELFRTEDAADAPKPEIEEKSGEMYLSSDCPAYHFPCIADLPAREEVPLPRGTRVRVVAYFGEGGQEEAQGGYTFAYVEYETAARSASKCYVPAAYLTEVDPLGNAGENYTLGYVKPGATFTDPNGNKIVTEERVQARLYQNEDGTYTARYEKEGVSYTANLEAGQIEWGESDAWRIALIVILSVVAVLIIGGYVFLLPWNKKQTK